MLSDRSILVTGGSSGIGRELVRQYAAQGARVLTTARRESALDYYLAATKRLLARETAHTISRKI